MTREWVELLVLVILTALLLVAVREDIRSRRIPNKLVLIGMLSGLAFNGLHPEGSGWLTAVTGLMLGMVLFLPMYLLRAMGAGDVKLMGMVGAFLGAKGVIGAALATLIAGGVLALSVALWAKQLAPMLRNIKYILFEGLIKAHSGQVPVLDVIPVKVGKLPYAVAITAGTLCYIILQPML